MVKRVEQETVVVNKRKQYITNYLRIKVKDIIVGKNESIRLSNKQCEQIADEICSLDLKGGIYRLLRITNTPLHNGYLATIFNCDLNIITSTTNVLNSEQSIFYTNRGWLAHDRELVKVNNLYNMAKSRLGGDAELEKSLLKKHFASRTLESLEFSDLQKFNQQLLEIYQGEIAKQQQKMTRTRYLSAREVS